MPAASTASPFRFELSDEIAVITLDPALKQAPWAEVERSGDRILQELGQRPTPRCVIDLSLLDYMGSSLVALLTRIWKNVKSAGGESVIVCPNDVPLEVIRIAGLDKIWSLAPTRPAALTRLGMAQAKQNRTPRLPLLWLVLAACGTVAALAGVGLHLSGSVSRSAAQGLIFGGGGCGLLFGLGSLAFDRSGRRYLGLAVVLLSVGAALWGMWRLPPPRPGQPPATPPGAEPRPSGTEPLTPELIPSSEPRP